MPPLRVMIVDDERPARQRLEYLLAREDDVEVVGSYADARDAAAAIVDDPPDLVLLDVQMPQMSGMELVRAVGPEAMPLTIFVTAFDQYAIKAFESAALDYLLKPFSDARYRQALDRARARLRERDLGKTVDRMRALVDAASAPAPAQVSDSSHAPRAEARAQRFVDRITVNVRGKLLIVPVRGIDYITADGPYAELHVGGTRYVIRERTQTLEERLDPARFCRIHRSTIVNIDRIASMEPLFRGDYEIRLTDGTRLRLSRTRRAALTGRLNVSR